MCVSERINNDMFLDWLKHFLKFKCEGKSLLILVYYGSHTSNEAIRFGKDHNTDLTGLLPHSSRVLQPVDRHSSGLARHNNTKMPQNGRTETEPMLSITFNFSFFQVHATKQRLWEQLLRFRVIVDERYDPNSLFQLHGI